MFEKKTINENRYSCEILCDFIIDKVKKLIGKVEGSSQAQAQVVKLQQQNAYLKDSWNILNNQVMPFLQNLLGAKKQVELSASQVTELLLNLEAKLKKNQIQSMSSGSMAELLNLKKEKSRLK